MTNFERIKNMTIEEMAENNIMLSLDDSCVVWYKTSSGIYFGEKNKHKAIQYEIEWLNSESEK